LWGSFKFTVIDIASMLPLETPMAVFDEATGGLHLKVSNGKEAEQQEEHYLIVPTQEANGSNAAIGQSERVWVNGSLVTSRGHERPAHVQTLKPRS